jgi:hypothetical protein
MSMSALGQKQTLERFPAMSAIHPKADIAKRDLVRTRIGAVRRRSCALLAGPVDANRIGMTLVCHGLMVTFWPGTPERVSLAMLSEIMALVVAVAAVVVAAAAVWAWGVEPPLILTSA